MALQAKVKGTLKELELIWRWETLSKLVRVDLYRRSMVSDTEVFTLTESDFIRVFGEAKE